MAGRGWLLLAGTLLGCLLVAGAPAPPPQLPPQCKNTTLFYDVAFAGKPLTIKAGTVTWNYRTFGPLAPQAKANPKPPVVLIPGLAFTMYIWPIPMLMRLANDRQVVIFDNMRTGGSKDSSKAPLTIPLMANQTSQFIKALKLKQKPEIIGWSIGGMIASTMAANYPDQHSRYVIMAGSVGGPVSQPWSPDTAAKIAAVPAGDYQRFMLWLFPDGINDDGFCSLAAAYNSWKPYSEGFFNKTWLAEQSRAINKFWKDNSTVQGIQKVRNRVLVLHGVQDRIVPISNAPLMSVVWRGAWMLQFPSVGAGIPFDAGQATIYLVLEFLQFAETLTPTQTAFYTFKPPLLNQGSG